MRISFLPTGEVVVVRVRQVRAAQKERRVRRGERAMGFASAELARVGSRRDAEEVLDGFRGNPEESSAGPKCRLVMPMAA